ncbi:hypothetical protein ACTXT7_016038 [Hymenolepis weldensis]
MSTIPSDKKAFSRVIQLPIWIPPQGFEDSELELVPAITTAGSTVHSDTRDADSTKASVIVNVLASYSKVNKRNQPTFNLLFSFFFFSETKLALASTADQFAIICFRFFASLELLHQNCRKEHQLKLEVDQKGRWLDTAASDGAVRGEEEIGGDRSMTTFRSTLFSDAAGCGSSGFVSLA